MNSIWRRNILIRKKGQCHKERERRNKIVEWSFWNAFKLSNHVSKTIFSRQVGKITGGYVTRKKKKKAENRGSKEKDKGSTSVTKRRQMKEIVNEWMKMNEWTNKDKTKIVNELIYLKERLSQWQNCSLVNNFCLLYFYIPACVMLPKTGETPTLLERTTKLGIDFETPFTMFHLCKSLSPPPPSP